MGEEARIRVEAKRRGSRAGVNPASLQTRVMAPSRNLTRRLPWESTEASKILTRGIRLIRQFCGGIARGQIEL